MITAFFKSTWGIVQSFRPVNLALIFGLHKIAQWVLIKDSADLFYTPNLLIMRQSLVQLMWGSILLAAAGYLINDYYDQTTDRINKANKLSPIVTRSRVLFWSIWIGLNLFAFYLGFSIDATTNQTSYGPLFFGISVILWAYNLSQWSKFIIGPLVISALVAFNLVLVHDLVFRAHDLGMNEAFTTEPFNNIWAWKTKWIWRIAYLGFITNFICEIIKDIEDINGDQNARRRTIPIVIGIARTAKVAVALGFILILSIAAFIAVAINSSIALSVNLAVALVLGIWITYKCSKIETQSQADSLSLMLKLLLVLGLICLVWL